MRHRRSLNPGLSLWLGFDLVRNQPFRLAEQIRDASYVIIVGGKSTVPCGTCVSRKSAIVSDGPEQAQRARLLQRRGNRALAHIRRARDSRIARIKPDTRKIQEVEEQRVQHLQRTMDESGAIRNKRRT